MNHWKKWGVLFGTGLSSMLVSIDFTIVNTSLVAIQNSLSASVIDLQWYISAFGIPFCVMLVIFGRVADLVGRRMVLYVGMISFAIASLFAGLSSSSLQLIFWRVMLGISGASIFPCGMALTAEAFPKNEHGKALGLYFGLLGMGLAMGPVIGGVITSYIGWNWIFFINIPVVFLSFLICLPSIDESKSKKAGPIDWRGLSLVLIGLTCLITWITEGSYVGWYSPISLILIATAFISLVLFYRSEGRTKYPLIPFDYFKNRNFVIATLSNTASISCMWAVIFLLPIYLQTVMHYTIEKTGLMMLVMTAMTVIASPIAGYILDKRGKKQVVLSIFAMLILGYLCFLGYSQTYSNWQLIVGLILIGFAWGCGNGIGGPIVLANHPNNANTGLISGAASTLLNIFGVLIVTQAGTIFRFSERSHLNYLIKKASLSLADPEIEAISAVMSQPEKLKDILSNFSEKSAQKIVLAFEQASAFGFQISIWFLLGLTTILLVMMVFALYPFQLKIGRKDRKA